MMLPSATSLSSKPNILIYVGKGTSQKLVAETIRSVKEAAPNHCLIPAGKKLLGSPEWHQDTALLVLPGGRDMQYVEALEGAPNESIRAYVANGGSYLGICAGAYYASDRIRFADNQPEVRVVGPRPLKFFRGLCEGPMTPRFDYNDFKGARAWKLQPEGGMAYYHGGGTFVGATEDPDVEVMHTYDAQGKLPATVVCHHGEGLAVLTGLHLEYSGLRLTEGNPPPLVASLVGSEPDRRATFAKLVQRGLQGSHKPGSAGPEAESRGESAGSVDGFKQRRHRRTGRLADGGHIVEIQ